MDNLNRISIDPAVVNGQPCIAGTRITVRRVLYALALYPDRKDLRANYPELDDEAIAQALTYAANYLYDEMFDMRAAS